MEVRARYPVVMADQSVDPAGLLRARWSLPKALYLIVRYWGLIAILSVLPPSSQPRVVDHEIG